MKTIQFNDLDLFMEATFSYLEKDEIQNNLMIGNCFRAKTNAFDSSNYLLGMVQNDEHHVMTIFMQTPPFPILIYEVHKSDEALTTLIESLQTQSRFIPGIVAEKTLAKRFSDLNQQITSCQSKYGIHMRVYRLDQVNHPTEKHGHLRLATEADLNFLPYWDYAFGIDSHSSVIPTDYMKSYEKIKNTHLKNGTLYVYENNGPVSQAACGRETQNGVVINAVYTPPYFRNQGYATEMMAELSQTLLNKGYLFCCLFTDLANPISNSIYQKVGYNPIMDVDEIWFNQ